MKKKKKIPNQGLCSFHFQQSDLFGLSGLECSLWEKVLPPWVEKCGGKETGFAHALSVQITAEWNMAAIITALLYFLPCHMGGGSWPTFTSQIKCVLCCNELFLWKGNIDFCFIVFFVCVMLCLLQFFVSVNFFSLMECIHSHTLTLTHANTIQLIYVT